MKTYEELVKVAGDLWLGTDHDHVIDTEFLRGQVQTLSDAFGVEQIKVREDILDAAGIYRNLRWDGVRIPLIESMCSPWVEDTESGIVFDFGGETAGFRSLTSGVLVCGTEIQRDDEAAMLDSFTDLHAARVAAAEVARITGRPHDAYFHGCY